MTLAIGRPHEGGENPLGWPHEGGVWHEIWACDFLQAYDAFFRPIFAFVFIELATRKVILAATTRFPSRAWVTQQLRNATPSGVAPRFLIRDRDDKFGTAFDALAVATGIRVIRTAVRAPNMNAICERFSRLAASRVPRPYPGA